MTPFEEAQDLLTRDELVSSGEYRRIIKGLVKDFEVARTALKIIHTWAGFEVEVGPLGLRRRTMSDILRQTKKGLGYE